MWEFLRQNAIFPGDLLRVSLSDMKKYEVECD